MKYVLSRGGLDALARFFAVKVLVAFDYDGTLAPLVSDPARAEMRVQTRALLGQIARAHPCAVISGRARTDVSLRLDGVTMRAVAGNHGAEVDASATGPVPRVEEWRRSFEHALVGLTGVEIEDKRLSLSVHYRRATDKRTAESVILTAAEALDGARIVLGKQVVNVVLAGAPHKGVALERIRVAEGCDAAFYVGDDETDEDVFRSVPENRLFGVRVGDSVSSHAAYYIRHQAEVDALLEALIRLPRENVLSNSR